MTADIRFNIKNPAGDYVQHERNLEVFRQTSQAKAKREKELLAEEKMKAASQEGAPEVPDVSRLSLDVADERFIHLVILSSYTPDHGIYV